MSGSTTDITDYNPGDHWRKIPALRLYIAVRSVICREE